ncbi:uncharacterized protein EV422DRAFT_33440 [Fimicolochytrium jonesii]|uniref:uncharacterized protein n=1 Tax=Fimicolochytrium jonesii TaxID=1396493 RepID=UPI0022FE2160|nr:uncharacterized protein EV422DRAFT_33440 [Fimicolochytrium jonesii]KAI8827245.1 hypothetical protein EV422DRAFT_33440 [Fimicolochytrium jonesii]
MAVPTGHDEMRTVVTIMRDERLTWRKKVARRIALEMLESGSFCAKLAMVSHHASMRQPPAYGKLLSGSYSTCYWRRSLCHHSEWNWEADNSHDSLMHSAKESDANGLHFFHFLLSAILCHWTTMDADQWVQNVPALDGIAVYLNGVISSHWPDEWLPSYSKRKNKMCIDISYNDHTLYQNPMLLHVIYHTRSRRWISSIELFLAR